MPAREPLWLKVLQQCIEPWISPLLLGTTMRSDGLGRNGERKRWRAGALKPNSGSVNKYRRGLNVVIVACPVLPTAPTDEQRLGIERDIEVEPDPHSATK